MCGHFRSPPLHSCVICLVLLCNSIPLLANPTRSDEWPRLQLFGDESARATLSREIRRSMTTSSSSNDRRTHRGGSSTRSSSPPHLEEKLSPTAAASPASSSSSAQSPASPATMTFGCAGCQKLRGQIGGYPGHHDTSSAMVSAAEKEFRIQVLKHQILDALHLTEPPKSKGHPPEITQEFIENVFGEGTDKPSRESIDAFDDHTDSPYSTETDKQFILGVTGGANRHGNDWTGKMSFDIPDDVRQAEEVRGKLWVKLVNASSATVRSIIVRQRFKQRPYTANVVASKRLGWAAGWTGIDLYSTWMPREQSVVFEVITISHTTQQTTINTTAEPILEVSATTRLRGNAHRRAKRGVTCQSPNPSSCCLQSLNVHVIDDLGWNWIVYPPNIDLNFCRGSCEAGANTIYNHSRILYTYSMEQGDPSVRAMMMPCCTPKRLATQQVIYTLGSQSYVERRIPNLRVLECGCA